MIPLGGYAGWAFLQRSLPRQMQTHAAAPAAQRDAAHFRARIGQVGSARELVADTRLLRVALTAFGLAEDLPNRAFLTRVLESPASEGRSFVNRLADKRYLELAAAFGFGDATPPRSQAPGFAETLLTAYRERRFEAAVGESDESMRLALALGRDLQGLAAGGLSEDASWYRVLGTPSLRKVFETAYHLPAAFGTLDLDRQLDIMRERTRRRFGDGSVAQFADPARIDRLIRDFFVGEQIGQIRVTGAGTVALTLLEDAQAAMASWRRR